MRRTAALDKTSVLSSNFKVVGIAYGLADSSILVSYLLGQSNEAYQVAALGIKLLLVFFTLGKNSFIVNTYREYSLIAVSVFFCSAFSAYTELGNLAKSLGFLAHLLVTLCLTRDSLFYYLKTIAISTSASAVLYFYFFLTNSLYTEWGRYFYLGQNHPNLGAEVAAAGALCAALTFYGRGYLLILIPLFVQSIILQGRSAMVAIAVMAFFKGIQHLSYSRSASSNKIRLLIIASFMVTIVAIVIPFAYDALQLGDRNRGIGSGVSGRNELWANAWNVFLDHPLTGIGPGYFNLQYMGYGPHNFFLYGLAEMGLVSLIVFAVFIRFQIQIFQRNRWLALYLFPFVTLLMTNDRFLSLNLYPFVYLFLLFALPAIKDYQPVAMRRKIVVSGKPLMKKTEWAGAHS